MQRRTFLAGIGGLTGAQAFDSSERVDFEATTESKLRNVFDRLGFGGTVLIPARAAPSTVTGCHLGGYGKHGITIEGDGGFPTHTIVGNTVDNCSRNNPWNWNGINLDNGGGGGGVCGLNSTPGNYANGVGGGRVKVYETGLNYSSS